MGVRARLAAVALACGLVSLGARAQATGDSRTVTEPSFPAVCTVLTAQQAITNDAPTDETLYDTTRIQTALTACPSGQAVELAGANGKFAFLSASLNLPTGVGLIVDGGVTLYASRKASDYQVSGNSETCGSYGSGGAACKYFFTFNNGGANTGCGIYGYGVIDLRGGSTILSATGADTGIKWWTNSDMANTAGQNQDNVSLMKPNKSTNLVLYKITIRNSPQFHVVTSNVSGETVWGVKIQAPFTAHNTDGIDPQGTNITIANSSISEGDDAIAVSGSSNSTNITVKNTNIYASHGISIGSYTQGGVSNMLVTNVNMAGEPTDGNQNGLRIKSALDRGGNVNNITYQNMCLRDIAKPVLITPVYNSNTGTLYPNFTNILMQNVHILPTTKTTKYTVSVAGIDANHLTGLTLNNVVSDQTLFYSPAFSYATIALAGNVYPAALQSQAGTGVTYTGTATATATPAYDCSATAAVFPALVGEMYVSTATTNNAQSASITTAGSVTLNAMVQPARSQVTFNGTVGNYTGAPPLTAAVKFYEGSTLVGTGTLGAGSTNNSLASLTLTGVTAGTHTYTAQYPGDTNYSVMTFGSVTVTVTGPTVTSSTTLIVSGTLTYGSTQTLTANVSPLSATGSVTFLDGGTSLGTCALSSASCSVNVMLGGGSGHSITAVYGGDATVITSTSAAKPVTIATASTTTGVTANPTTVAAGATTSVTVSVAGVTGAAVPAGTVTLTDAGSTVGTITLANGTGSAQVMMSTAGSRTLLATYSGDANYAASSGTAAVTVTALATTTTLRVSPSTTYAGASVTLTATVTPAVAGLTVSFVSGQLTLGTATTDASGNASYVWTAPAFSTSVTASTAASGNYAASTSAAASLSVVPAVTVTATPNPVSVAAGSSATVTIALPAGSGFAGTLTASCTSPVKYVTCTPAQTSVVLNGTTAGASSVTISVAATTGMLSGARGLELASVLGLLGLIGVRRRKVARLLVLLTLVGIMGLSGCGGATTSGTNGGGSGGMKPSGSPIVIYTVTSGNVSVPTQITVNIQ